MKLFSLDTVLDVVDKVEKSLAAATEPTLEHRYAIEYTLECVRDELMKKYNESGSNP